jgi:hypothetical protein
MHRSFAVALLVFHSLTAHAEPFSFAAMGDAPYNLREREEFERMLDGLAREKLAFAVHIGDLKSGHSDCDDAIYADRLKLFDSSPLPLVYIPGDNDWADCSRWESGGWLPEERLARLRTVFFTQDESLGRARIPVERQHPPVTHDCCPENVRWWHGGILFMSVHMVGSKNNRGAGDDPKPEFVIRTTSNVAWLREGFRLAHERAAPGFVLFIHANASLERIDHFRREYAAVLDALWGESIAFGKPVLLVHGDTHRFQLGRPWWRAGTREGVPNLLRLETPGSPSVAWVPIRVDPASPEVFSVGPPRAAPPPPR